MEPPQPRSQIPPLNLFMRSNHISSTWPVVDSSVGADDAVDVEEPREPVVEDEDVVVWEDFLVERGEFLFGWRGARLVKGAA